MEGDIAGSPFLCVHGHFYQTSREDPFTGNLPTEPGAEPYHDFNEKSAAECYRPQSEAGNFSRISFDLGSTLARWLETNDLATYRNIVAGDRKECRRVGLGNAMAQPYSYPILPLADPREKQVQVGWGMADFRRRFGRRPEGMWLPETAVDYATLGTLADFGLRYTILAPWQAEGGVDTSEPYLVRLPGGRQMTVFFYNATLSEAVAYHANKTVDPPWFSASVLRSHLNQGKLSRGEPQVLLVAAEGGLYGRHQPLRDQFLTHLLAEDAPGAGFAVGSLSQYLHHHPPRREVVIRQNTSWSCDHGLTRWRGSCPCSDWHGDWKWYLRRAFNRLAARIDLLFEDGVATILHDPWAALLDYLPLHRSEITQDEFYEKHARRWPGGVEALRLNHVFKAQYARQMMFNSWAFVVDDLDRVEARNAIAWAARAIELLRSAGIPSLEEGFVQDLATVRSGRAGRDGAQIYGRLTGRRREGGSIPSEPVTVG